MSSNLHHKQKKIVITAYKASDISSSHFPFLFYKQVHKTSTFQYWCQQKSIKDARTLGKMCYIFKHDQINQLLYFYIPSFYF